PQWVTDEPDDRQLRPRADRWRHASHASPRGKSDPRGDRRERHRLGDEPHAARRAHRQGLSPPEPGRTAAKRTEPQPEADGGRAPKVPGGGADAHRLPRLKWPMGCARGILLATGRGAISTPRQAG